MSKLNSGLIRFYCISYWTVHFYGFCLRDGVFLRERESFSESNNTSQTLLRVEVSCCQIFTELCHTINKKSCFFPPNIDPHKEENGRRFHPGLEFHRICSSFSLKSCFYFIEIDPNFSSRASKMISELTNRTRNLVAASSSHLLMDGATSVPVSFFICLILVPVSSGFCESPASSGRRRWIFFLFPPPICERFFFFFCLETNFCCGLPPFFLLVSFPFCLLPS